MATIKNLTGIPMADIHAAFNDAFSEYEVDMSMPLERLQEMMTRNSYDPSLSLGYFADGQLAGFLLMGYREINGKRVGYDSGTGVIKEYQRQGIGDALLQAFMEVPYKERLDHFVLEVLVNNHGAKTLYEKHGFNVTRRLNCYERAITSDAREQAGKIQHDNSVEKTIAFNDKVDESLYSTFTPSWQNALASYRLVPEKHQFVSISEQGKILAYGIVHKERGRILQLGLHPDHRNARLTEEIALLLSKATENDTLAFLNVEENSVMDTLIQELGFTSIVSQYEMVYAQ